jgi:hypothetical protein
MYNQTGGATPPPNTPPTDAEPGQSQTSNNGGSGAADGVEEAEYTVVDDK